MFLTIVLLYLSCLGRQCICETCSYNLSNSAGTINTWDYDSVDQYVGSTCEWTINVPQEAIMSVKVDRFDWKDCFEINCCENVPLQIWVGGQILKEYCNFEVYSDALSIRDMGPIVVRWDVRRAVIMFRIRYSSRSAHVCPSHHFECIDRRRCYNSSEFCDEYPECFDHSDEENCSPLCENDHVPCFSGSIECFHPVHQRCDGSMDCPNGKDELSCSYDCPGKFSCGNFTGCFDLDLRCDGHKDCESGLDETNCTTTCSSFICKNGNCIDDVLVNNGVDDCGDGSDENRRTKPKTSIMVIISVCAMILTIGFIVLMYRWLHTRRDMQHLLANLPQIPLPPFEGPGERDGSVVYDIQFSETDYMRGGEIYEAFVQTRRGMVSTQRGHRNRSVRQTKSLNSVAVAVRQLGVLPEYPVGLDKGDCEIILKKIEASKEELSEIRLLETGVEMKGPKIDKDDRVRLIRSAESVKTMRTISSASTNDDTDNV